MTPARSSRDASATCSLTPPACRSRRSFTSRHPDRDGAPQVLAGARYLYPWLRHVFADGGYSGVKLATALDQIGRWRIEIVKRCDAVEGFVVLPRRWVVERTFAWLNRNRRFAKDFEASLESALALRSDPLSGRSPTSGVSTDSVSKDFSYCW